MFVKNAIVQRKMKGPTCLGRFLQPIDIFTALLTPIIAITAIFIGALQWRINKIRLKHELFDRRWEQFIAVRDHLWLIARKAGKTTQEEEDEFAIKTTGCQFIFDTDIDKFVYEIYLKRNLLKLLNEELENLKSGDKRRKKFSERKLEIKQWVRDQSAIIAGRFHLI